MTERRIPASPNLVQGIDGSIVRFALVDAFENEVIAGFRADINQIQTGFMQRLQIFDRLARDVIG